MSNAKDLFSEKVIEPDDRPEAEMLDVRDGKRKRGDDVKKEIGRRGRQESQRNHYDKKKPTLTDATPCNELLQRVGANLIGARAGDDHLAWQTYHKRVKIEKKLEDAEKIKQKERQGVELSDEDQESDGEDTEEVEPEEHEEESNPDEDEDALKSDEEEDELEQEQEQEKKDVKEEEEEEDENGEDDLDQFEDAREQ